MAKAIIIYGSSTGNTEKLAHILAGELKQRFSVTLLDAVDAVPEDLIDNDIIIFGSSTWYEGELQDDFQEFYDGVDTLDLAGKKVAVFGTGDSTWDEFCQAVDTIEGKARQMNAQIVVPGFKWDGDLNEEAFDSIIDWGKQLH